MQYPYFITNTKFKIMTVKAKFRCNTIVDTKHQGGSYRHVSFSAIYGNEGENKDFAKSTPWGEIKLQIDESTAAFDAFIPGKDYYINLSEA